MMEELCRTYNYATIGSNLISQLKLLTHVEHLKPSELDY